MTLLLNLFVILSVLELLITNHRLWSVRRPLAAGLAIGLALVTGGLLGNRLSLAMILIGIISLYRVVSLLRMVQSKSNQQYLRLSVRTTTLILFAYQLILFGALQIADATHPTSDTWWLILSIVQCISAIGIMSSLLRQLRKTKPPEVSEHFTNEHLPSISVCIPARNESIALEDCLRSLVANDYPKLEILVLDDCSQGSRTSDIIRSFAHDGVRFVKGSPPDDNWLAKNWAYQQLFDESSGAYVLFAGVDVRFEPTALRGIITTLLAKDKRMMSLIPRNEPPKALREQLTTLIQPTRYAWELFPPRRLFNRPPILSSCWVADRTLLDRTGGFDAVTHSISPESYFARRALLRDGYSFVQSTPGLAISSLKTRAEQWDTAVRTRYPQLRRRIDLVAAVTFVEIVLFIAPLPMTIVAAVNGLWLQLFFAGLSTLLLGFCYGRVVTLTYRQQLVRGYLMAPFAALLDIYIRHESLWRYEFDEITWKGRNVCLPVMRVIPHLPKI